MGEKYKIGKLRAGNVAIGDHAPIEVKLLPTTAVKFEKVTGHERTTLLPLREIWSGGLG